jgi:hypothetical protein
MLTSLRRIAHAALERQRAVTSVYPQPWKSRHSRTPHLCLRRGADYGDGTDGHIANLDRHAALSADPIVSLGCQIKRLTVTVASSACGI